MMNATAVGIYGARSANGVIAIFTKKGGGAGPLPERTGVTKRLRIVVQGISNEGIPISFTRDLPVRRRTKIMGRK